MWRGQRAVSWTDAGLVADAAARLVQQVLVARTPKHVDVRTPSWPTHPVRKPAHDVDPAAMAGARPTEHPQSTPWPSQAPSTLPEGGSVAERVPAAQPAPDSPCPASSAPTAPVATPAGVEAARTSTPPVATEHLRPSPASDAVPSPHQGDTRSVPAAADPLPSAASAAPAAPAAPSLPEDDEYDAATETRSTPLRATRVPASRLGRLLHYGSLGAGLAWGSAGEYMRRATGTKDAAASPLFLSEANVNRLVDKLSTMRGAALKLGQFLSIQDSHMLPPQVEQVMLRVQNSAHYMPAWQLERVMRTELGEEWRSAFASFDERPFAAASIGQVHSAVLADPFPTQPEMAGRRVAVKVQFPGVAESIGSDLSNIKWLLMASSLLPKGLFLESSVRVLQKELEEECDYTREADMGRQFAAHVAATTPAPGALRLEVPTVVDALCTSRVLTTEFMRGRPLTQTAQLDQSMRDRIALTVMDLSLRELFEWRLMQTDPNWTNFLYSDKRQSLQLIDFGASRPYTREFMDLWISLLRAAVSGDRAACEAWSIAIGYLTGEEPETMRTAHVDSMITLGEPFRKDAPRPYPFANQTITDRVRAQIPVMIRERHRPPPPETYSLNRKLSGAFLLCARLGASVDCHGLFTRITDAYVYANGSRVPPAPNRRPVRGVHTQTVQRHGLHTTPPSRRLGRNLGDTWANFPLDDLLVEHIEQRDAAHPNTTTPPKLRFTGRAQSEPTLNFLSSEQIRQESPGTVRVRSEEVPIRPSPPGAEDCCMSGCVNCVYNLYADDVEEWKEATDKIRAKLANATPPITTEEWDPKLLGALPHETNAHHEQHDEEEAVGPEDPSLKAFMQLEQRITRKHRSAAKTTEARSEL